MSSTKSTIQSIDSTTRITITTDDIDLVWVLAKILSYYDNAERMDKVRDKLDEMQREGHVSVDGSANSGTATSSGTTICTC